MRGSQHSSGTRTTTVRRRRRRHVVVVAFLAAIVVLVTAQPASARTRSQNGWRASSDRAAISIVTVPVPGSAVSLSVKSGVAGQILIRAAARFNRDVERLEPGQTWGYNYRCINRGASPPRCVVSNHGSGTAIDLNSAYHPDGARGTFTRYQVSAIRSILTTCGPALRWGGDYSRGERGRDALGDQRPAG
jgi:hypothetical protein